MKEVMVVKKCASCGQRIETPAWARVDGKYYHEEHRPDRRIDDK